MEDMCTIIVNLDSHILTGMDITGNSVPFINDKALFARLSGFMCKYTAIEACTYYKIVIIHNNSPLEKKFC
jgi:hypothetical protein